MLDDFLHSPLAQGMAGGLALVVLFVALKLAVKAVKAAFTLLVLGALVLLAAAAVWAWRDGGGAARARDRRVSRRVRPGGGRAGVGAPRAVHAGAVRRRPHAHSIFAPSDRFTQKA